MAREGRGQAAVQNLCPLGRVALVGALEATRRCLDAGCSLFGRLGRPERQCWNRNETWAWGLCEELAGQPCILHRPL